MKPLFRSALPALDKTARLPLALALLLAAALVLQLAVADNVRLPDTGPVAGGRARSSVAPAIIPATGAIAITRRAMFAPNAAHSLAGAGPQVALAGVTIVGSVQVGRVAYVVVHGPGEHIVNVPVGGKIGAWRLRALSGASAQLARGKDRSTVLFGAVAPAPPAPPEGNQ